MFSEANKSLFIMIIMSKLKNYDLKIFGMNDVMFFDDYQDYLLLIDSYEIIFAYKKLSKLFKFQIYTSVHGNNVNITF